MGLDGRPNWSAPKAVGLWIMIALALAVRLLIWAATAHTPKLVHGEELGLLMSSVVIAAVHVYLLGMAVRAISTGMKDNATNSCPRGGLAVTGA